MTTKRKDCGAAVKHGKLAVGVEFALRKLVQIRENPRDQTKVAVAAIEKVKTKGIHLPPLLRAALLKLSAK